MIRTVLLAFIGSVTSGLLFNIKGRKLIFAGVSGLVGSAVYTLLNQFTEYSIFSIFIGAIAVGLYSETAARLLKSPSTVFSIPGILPLVPGITAYEMAQFIMNNEPDAATGKLIETVEGAGAIAFGIMIVTAVFRFISRVKKMKQMETANKQE